MKFQHFLIAIGLAFMVTIGYQWWSSSGSAVPGSLSSPSAGEHVEVIPEVPLKVYTAQRLKQTVLAPAVKNDKQNHLVGTSRAEIRERPVEINTILDSGTGDITTIVTRLPSPLFRIDPRTEIYAEMGMNSYKGDLVAKLGVNHQIFKVKDVGLGVTAQVDSKGNSFVGGRVSYRW